MKFEIEQYELHAQKYTVHAENKVEAIKALFDGGAEVVPNGLTYVQVAEEYYQPALFNVVELEEIDKFSTTEDDCVPSIRNITEISRSLEDDLELATMIKIDGIMLRIKAYMIESKELLTYDENSDEEYYFDLDYLETHDFKLYSLEEMEV